MSVIGKLIIDGESFNLLSYSNRFYQQRDIAGRPRGRVNGGLMQLKIEAHRDHIFHHWMMNPDQMRDLEIVFSPVTKISKSRVIQCYDVYCARLAVHFDNYTTNPMTYTLVLSPGIIVDGGVVFEKPWKVTDLSAMGGEVETDPINDPEPNFVEYYFQDANGEKITQNEISLGEEITLVVVSENAKGMPVTINLDDKERDFEYKGQPLKNDTLSGVNLTGNRTRFELKAIKQKES